MKGYRYLILGSICFLTACSAKNVPAAGSDAAAQNTAVVAGTNENTDSRTGKEETTGTKDQEVPRKDMGKESNHTGLVPLNVELSADYHGEWKDQKMILRSECSTIYVLDEGYPELDAALKVYNENNCQEIFTIYTENLEWAKEANEKDDVLCSMDLFISRSIEVTRSDDRILSFWNREESYLGGAHGGYYAGTANFDPLTGSRLALSDITGDYDALCHKIKDALKAKYEKGTFFENYEETLDEMFDGISDDGLMPLEWTMDENGITVSFSPYVIAPWSSSELTVEIPFAGNETLFLETYQEVPEHPAKQIGIEERFFVDTDGDGEEETVWFSCTYDEETYSGNLFLHVMDTEKQEISGQSRDGQTAGGQEKAKTQWDGGEYHGSFADAWLMENQSGHPYLYVEFTSENDYRRMEIYDLAAEGELPFAHVKTTEESVYGHFLSDSSEFALYTRIYLLGTYDGYRMYSVGADGTPVAKGEVYRITLQDGEPGCTLVSKREIPVRMHEDGVKAEDRKTEVLPSGTVFRLRQTDGSGYVEMELEDGRRCDIHVEKDTDRYEFLIDGVSEYDCFETLYYAG